MVIAWIDFILVFSISQALFIESKAFSCYLSFKRSSKYQNKLYVHSLKSIASSGLSLHTLGSRINGWEVLVSTGRREGWKIRESQIRRGFEISERADFDKLQRKGLFLYENQFYH